MFVEQRSNSSFEMLQGTSIEIGVKRRLVPIRTKIDARLVVRMLAILLAGVAVLTREMEIVVALK